MLKSKRVYEEEQTYTGIKVPAGASDADVELALAELKLFCEEYFGADAEAHEIEVIPEADGSTAYRFATVYQMHGTDYNPQIYPDAVYATDLIT